MARPKRVTPTNITYPDDLPIAARHDEILATIAEHQVVVIAGETGSGKSTQLPKFCLELGRGVDGWIGHTQPRRIAARAVAERVASELKVEVGQTIGYAVRFTDKVGSDTMVKVMTDGILLAEIQRDRKLSRYDTIIIDEAHERSLNIDFLLGYLKQLLPRRPDLKVIITSATIDTQRFSEHFDNAPIIEVSGRTYPVEIRYRPLDEPTDDGVEPEPGNFDARDQAEGIADAVDELLAEVDGDILVFCSGEREIRDTVETIEARVDERTEVVPLYGRLSAAEQHRVFEQHRKRRIVVATNVAETSLTVPGIRSVIDAGTARISRYSRRTKVQRLPIEAISQASANQRSGRCGRIGPGIAIRLYSEADYESRPEFTDPEIQRTNLASVILQMAAIRLGDIEAFPFVDPPDHRSIRDGIALLEELRAVDPERQGTGKWLTPLGRQLARLPIDPRMARMLLAAADNGCLREVLIIASGLAILDPRERPQDKREKADEFHKRFADAPSDFLSLLQLWDYVQTERRNGSASRFRRLCRREYLNYSRIREWQDLHSQLKRVTKDLQLTQNTEPADADVVHYALLHGLLSQVGTKDKDSFEYRGARNTKFAIAPGSTLFRKGPKWVMAAELVETNRMWARGAAPIQPAWLETVGDHLVKRTTTDPWWDAEKGAAVATQSVSFFGIPLAANRQVMWSSVNELDAHDMFVIHALVRGEWERNHPFVAHNAAVLEEAVALETRLRRSDLLVDEDTLADLFEQRVPDHVTSVASFDKWWRRKRKDKPELLNLTLDDMVRTDPDALDDGSFPETWQHGDVTIGLAYSNDPTTSWDGVTIDIPVSALHRIDKTTFEWQVPGFRRELVEGLIRSMPKRIRKVFVPIPETLDAIYPQLDPADGGLHETLRTVLARHADMAIPPDAFNPDKLDNHLRPSFRVIGDDDKVIAEGTDLDALKDLLEAEVRQTLASNHHEVERVGLTSWDIGTLPRVVDTEGPGHTVRAYPALVDEGETVAVRLLPSADDQAAAMWDGTRRLLMLNRPSVSKALRDLLTSEVKLALLHGPYDGPQAWFDDLMVASVDQLLLDGGGPAWDATGYDALQTLVRNQLSNVVATMGRASAGVLMDLRVVQTAAAALPPKFAEAGGDIEFQLERLVYPGFLTGLGGDRLPDLRRYLQAIEYRIEQLPENPRRDDVARVRVQVLEAEFDRLASIVPMTVELENIMWMIQELRISLFAQPIGTKETVSDKRIRRAMAAIADPR